MSSFQVGSKGIFWPWISKRVKWGWGNLSTDEVRDVWAHANAMQFIYPCLLFWLFWPFSSSASSPQERLLTHSCSSPAECRLLAFAVPPLCFFFFASQETFRKTRIVISFLSFVGHRCNYVDCWQSFFFLH